MENLFLGTLDVKQRKLSKPSDIDPEKKKRLDKIRKEFNEFNMVDDR